MSENTKPYIAGMKRAVNARDFQTSKEKAIKAAILENAQKLNNTSRANGEPFATAISSLLLDLAIAELEPETCDKCGQEVHSCR